MSIRVIAFVDHEIGYRLLEKMIFDHRGFDLKLVAVVTSLENGGKWWPGVEGLCRANKIPIHRYREPFRDIYAYIDIDWYFLLSWKHLLPIVLINSANRGAINLHYSLLPEYRGVYPVNWAIIEGKKETGVTYHLINEVIDAGYVVCQKTAPIYLTDNSRLLQLRLDDLAFDLFDEMLDLIKGFIPSETTSWQKIDTDTKSTYKSRADFTALSELKLGSEYKVFELINLLRGKNFFQESKDLYVIEPITGEKIYINIRFERNSQQVDSQIVLED